MKREIIINSTLDEIRVAITENGRLVELLWELPDNERHIGNIYLGRVKRIVQGMNASFIDIGMKQDAFLHFSDVSESLEEHLDDLSNEEEDDDDDEMENEPSNPHAENGGEYENLSEDVAIALRLKKRSGRDISALPTFSTKRSGEVKISLEEGQNVVVQAIREAYDKKGLRITTKITLPGRYLVLSPFAPVIGVSKKIHQVRERRRLRRIVKSMLPPITGCIVRTEAENQKEEALRKDLEVLLEQWRDIEHKIRTQRPPHLLYTDANLVRSLIRDQLNSEVSRVLVDSKKLYRDLKEYMEWAAPKLADCLEYHPGPEPIFDHCGILRDVENTYSRQIKLPSGGSIVFDHTEAMVIIDVNSGRYAEAREQEVNSLKTNLEALREIARQVRLRDIGGMIVIDFIDQLDDRNKKRIYEEMKKELRKDSAKSVVFPLTQLGLLQITRQRVRNSIMQVITEQCTTCKGAGTVPSKYVVINQIEHWLQRFRAESREFRLELTVSPLIGFALLEGRLSKLTRLQIKYFVQIKLRTNDNFAYDEFQFYSVKRQKEISRKFS